MPSGGLSTTRSLGAEAGSDFDLVAEIAGDRHRLDRDAIVVPTVATCSPLRSKISALAGTLIATSGCGRSKLTLVKAPVISSPLALSTTSCIRVVPDATSTDCAEPSTVAAKCPAGIFGNRDLRLGADPDARHVVLRNVDVDAQLADVRDDEHRRAAAAAGIDQRADVGVARRDEAVERRGDALVLLEHSQALEIGFGRTHQPPACSEARRRADRGPACDTAPELISCWPRSQRHFRQPRVRLGAGEVGFGLHDLLVEIGRVDLGERLARLDDVPMSACQSSRSR